MNFWWWVLVFGGIALVALVVYALLGLRLWRKAKVLLADLARLSTLVGTLQTRLGPDGSGSEPAWTPDPIAIGRHRAG